MHLLIRQIVTEHDSLLMTTELFLLNSLSNQVQVDKCAFASVNYAPIKRSRPRIHGAPIVH